jgi:hypothetical protein
MWRNLHDRISLILGFGNSLVNSIISFLSLSLFCLLSLSVTQVTPPRRDLQIMLLPMFSPALRCVTFTLLASPVFEPAPRQRHHSSITSHHHSSSTSHQITSSVIIISHHSILYFIYSSHHIIINKSSHNHNIIITV